MNTVSMTAGWQGQAMAERIRRVATAIRARLAPTAEGLVDVPKTRIKTRWLLGAWAALSAVSAFGTAITPALVPFPLVMMAFNQLAGVNYGYLNRKPDSASLLDLLGPWPVYVAAEVAILLLVWAGMTWPWVRGRRTVG